MQEHEATGPPKTLFDAAIERVGEVLMSPARAALAERLTTLATDAALRARLGAAGRDHVLRHHAEEAELAVVLGAAGGR